MSNYLNILVECPTPVGPATTLATHCFPNAFAEQVVLRTLPLLRQCVEQNRPMSFVVSSASIEALARLNWLDIIDAAEKNCAPSSSEVLRRLTCSRAILTQFGGSVIDALKSAVEQTSLRLIARPFEGIDLSCWISHPGILNFHFKAVQAIFQAYFGTKPTEISLIGSGYAPHLDAALNDAGFTVVFVDSEAVSGAQSKLTFGIHRPVLNPANGIAICAVDTQTLPTLCTSNLVTRTQWLNTGRGALLRDDESGLSLECYPNEDGLVNEYDRSKALSAFGVGLDAATRSLKRRLTGAGFKQQHTLTSLWCPTHENLWWEETELADAIHRLANSNQWTISHAVSYLAENPEQETAWLGSVLSSARDEAEHVWLPRRVVALFERFRAASVSQEGPSALQRFEAVARLLLFSKVSTRTYHSASSLEFLKEQTSAMILDDIERLLDNEAGIVTNETQKDTDHLIVGWASNVSLVSATRA